MNEEQLQELLEKLACVLKEPTPHGLYDKIRNEIHARIIQEEQMQKYAQSEGDVPETEITYGVKQVQSMLVFTTRYPEAKEVLLAGNFNNWTPEANPMQRVSESGIWQARITLRQGTYEYRFVVDGKWQQDPYNEQRKPSHYGGYNSVVEVKEHAPCLTGVGSPQLTSVAI